MSLKQGYHWTRRFWRPTRQQRRVLDALVEGRTNPEIAALLDISLDGAKWHVSHLFEKTDCETRQELAGWWLEHRERYQRSLIGLPLLWLSPRLAAVLAIVAIAASVTGVLFLGLGRSSGDSDSIAAVTTATPAGLAAAAPLAPTPTATPPAQAQAGAWVFDVDARSISPLPGAYTSRRWLDANELSFVVFSGPAVVDASGKQTVDLNPRSTEYTLGYPYQQRGTVALWRPEKGDLRIVDAKTGQQIASASFNRAPSDGRTWDVSVRGGRIALTEASASEIRVFSYGLNGSDRTELYRGRPDAWVSSVAWSPEGSYLLIRVGPRSSSGLVERFLVVEPATSRVLVEEDGSATWAGDGRLITHPASHPPLSGRQQESLSYLEVATGQRRPAADTAGLICVSPNGRSGIFTSETGPGSNQTFTMTARLKDLSTGAVLAEASMARNMVDCDWTWDSRKAVLSPGGK